MTSLIKP